MNAPDDPGVLNRPPSSLETRLAFFLGLLLVVATVAIVLGAVDQRCVSPDVSEVQEVN